MPSPPRYPSDLSDKEWALLEPLLESPEMRPEGAFAIHNGYILRHKL